MYWLKKYWFAGVIFICISVWVVFNINSSQEPEKSIITKEEEFDIVEAEEMVKEEPSILMVDIKGEVQHPGVYQVDENDRIQDVIKLAGGLTESAEINAINMAERVYDEMVILIPKIGEIEQNIVSSDTNGKDSSAKIKINQATKEELMTIPGIGEVKANAILQYREENGKYKKAEDLTEVTGIGEKTLEKMIDFIQVP